jgi:hypothetical protein
MAGDISASKLEVPHLCSRGWLGDDTDESLITLCADCPTIVARKVIQTGVNERCEIIIKALHAIWIR